MTTLTLTAKQLDILDVWNLLDKYNVNLSINEIKQQGNVVLSDSERIVVRNNQLMLEVV